MKSKTGRLALPFRLFFPFTRSGLRARMTISYLFVTLGSVLSFVILLALVESALSSLFPDTGDRTFVAAMQQQAQSYAIAAAVQAQGGTLDPQTNFIPGHAHTLASPGQENLDCNASAPYINVCINVSARYTATASPDPISIPLALLIAPDSRLVASSYPSRYPTGMPVSALLTEQMRAIDQALAGQTSSGAEHLSSVNLAYVAVPVVSRDHRPIGTIFLQVPLPSPSNLGILSAFMRLLFDFSNIVLLLLVTPVGVFFGWITTRGLVRRVQQLVVATTQFAGGDYNQRVESRHQDEIGQLERQFNQMAEQLVENISRRQQLSEQNARLEERARISRELHDAISQELFSLRMLAYGLQDALPADSSLQPHMSTLEHTTTRMIREMRALLLELRPTHLEQVGLAEALEDIAAAYRTRLGITVTVTAAPVSLNVQAEHALLRIAQEGLSNAVRHAHATQITLALERTEKGVTFTIIDNGHGFDASQVQHGLGLHLMQERIQEFHGTFALHTATGQGTQIVISLPQEAAS